MVKAHVSDAFEAVRRQKIDALHALETQYHALDQANKSEVTEILSDWKVELDNASAYLPSRLTEQYHAELQVWQAKCLQSASAQQSKISLSNANTFPLASLSQNPKVAPVPLVSAEDADLFSCLAPASSTIDHLHAQVYIHEASTAGHVIIQNVHASVVLMDVSKILSIKCRSVTQSILIFTSQSPSLPSPSMHALQLLLEHLQTDASLDVTQLLPLWRQHAPTLFSQPCDEDKAAISNRSLWIEGAQNCMIICDAQQVRLHDSRNLTLIGTILTHPIMEHCQAVQLMPRDQSSHTSSTGLSVASTRQDGVTIKNFTPSY